MFVRTLACTYVRTSLSFDLSKINVSQTSRYRTVLQPTRMKTILNGKVLKKPSRMILYVFVSCLLFRKSISYSTNSHSRVSRRSLHGHDDGIDGDGNVQTDVKSWQKEELLYQDDKEDTNKFSSLSSPSSSLTDVSAGDTPDLTYSFNLQIRDCVDDITHAEELLHQAEQMGVADTVTYNALLNVYAKRASPVSIGIGTKAHAVLNRMKQISQIQSGNLGQEQDLRDSSNYDDTPSNEAPSVTIKPNVRTYSTVMLVFSKERNAQTVQELLEELIDLYESTNDEQLRPNVIAYNTVLNALAKCGLAQQAQNILDQMREENVNGEIKKDKEERNTDVKLAFVEPDIISYNAVLHAWARYRASNNGEQKLIPGKEAEKLLRSMPITPNARSYTTVMDAWSRSCDVYPDAAQKAHDLLLEMEELYPQNLPQLQPNTISYSTVMNAYAQSTVTTDKAFKCYGLLQRMQHLYSSGENIQVKPTLVTYNSVLNACAMTANPKEKEFAYQIVKKLYKQLVESSEPDNFTYGTVLKACANLATAPCFTNEEFVESVFKKCCESGQVTFGVCYQLRQAASTELYRSLLPRESLNRQNLHFDVARMPVEWRCNVKNNKRSEFDRYPGKRQMQKKSSRR